MPPTIVPIDSMDDPKADVFRDVRDADLRGRDGLFMAESELVLRRLLRSPDRIHSLLLSPEKFRKLRDEIEPLPERIDVLVAGLRLIHEIAAFHVHRGVLAAGIRPSAEEVSLERALAGLDVKPDCTVLVAEGLTNVDNMGGLFRNAAAFGVDAIVLDPTCCDPLYRKAIRVSMGHALSIPWAICRDWPGDLDRLRSRWGLTLVGAEVTERSKPLWEMPRASKMAIAFGSEGHGLSEGALSRCDAVCAIPMAKDVPSLNVAVASAAFLYERQRRQATGKA